MSNDGIEQTGAGAGSRGLVTALVVLRPAPGSGSPGPDLSAPPSLETLGELTPAEGDVAATGDAMRELGFDVGPFLGNSMSITATVERFEALFGVRLVDEGGVWSVAGRRSDSAEQIGEAEPGPGIDGNVDDQQLPADRLGAAVAGPIERILLEPPMELHQPEGFMP